MKKLSVIILTLLIIFPSVSMGETKTVTVRWENFDDSNIVGYRVYFAFDIGMNDKQIAGQTSDPSATELECPNINLTAYKVYFTLAAVNTDGTELTSDPFEKTYGYGPSAPENLRIES
jgi:hypothetical protein